MAIRKIRLSLSNTIPLFFFLLPLITKVVVPSGRPYCFRVELLLNGLIIKKVSIAGSPSSRGITMTITSLFFRFRCRPPKPTIFAPNRHCSSSRWLLPSRQSRLTERSKKPINISLVLVRWTSLCIMIARKVGIYSEDFCCRCPRFLFPAAHTIGDGCTDVREQIITCPPNCFLTCWDGFVTLSS